jgi:hypothetical protein
MRASSRRLLLCGPRHPIAFKLDTLDAGNGIAAALEPAGGDAGAPGTHTIFVCGIRRSVMFSRA